MIKKKLYVWSCDYSNKTGEGNLARLFSKELKKNFILNLKNPKNLNIHIKILNYKYLSPFVGIFFCWYFYLAGKRVCYLNYLPMWNFILFLFLPPSTILGPITGGSNYRNNNKLIRKFLFPIFYKISEIFLLLRNTETIFSTDLLKKYLSKKTIKKSKFNFIFKAYQKKIRLKKNIDFVLYYRKHKNKEDFFPINLVKKLLNKKLKVHVVGDVLNVRGIKNHGKINQGKINKLLSKTKYSIISGESLYTFFTFDCINNNVKILVNKNYNQKVTKFKKSFIKIDFNSKKIPYFF